MSKKEDIFCEECGAEFLAGDTCKCHIVAAELDPAREPDAIEVLISVAKKALQAIDVANEESEGPMAMPVPVAEDLREAIYSLEDIMALLPYELLLKLRMEMINADFNARTMRNEGVEDLEAYMRDYGPMTPRQEDGIEIDPLALDEDGPFEAGQHPGMSIREVIERYKPDIQVKCPHVEECISVEDDGFRTCPHSDFHRVDEGCFHGCDLHEGSTGCKPMEIFDEETIE